MLQANNLEISQLYFRVLMVEINENLEKDEVGSLGFLLRDYAPRMKMAKDKVCFPQFWHFPLQQRDITLKKYVA